MNKIPAFIFFIASTLTAQEIPLQPTPQGPTQEVSSTRALINLNGLWKFQPAVGTTAQKPSNDDWGSIWVPGTWARGGGLLGNIQEKGSGEGWKVPGDDLRSAWYERDIVVPKEWSGRAVLLDFRRVSTDAEVWVNDKECGKVSWPYGMVDITKAVKAGEQATVRVIVVATPDEGEITNFMGYAQESKSKAQLQSAGLIGEVFLESRPQGAHISDVFVQTSTRKGEIALEVEIKDLLAAGDIQFSASITDAAGAEVKVFAQTVPGILKGTQVLKLSSPWSDAKLWDLDQPNLYTLRLSATGSGLSDQFAVRFGFREVWIEGRDIFLNGTPLRLRPVLLDSGRGQAATMDSQLKGLRGQGFNIVQIWPENAYERGKANFHDLWAERTDEIGVPLIHVAQSANRFIFDSDSRPVWDKNRDRYREVMEAEMRRLRNHPSILMWGTSGNLSNHQSDQNPRYLGQKAKLLAVDPLPPGLVEALAMIKAADPTRPVFAHAGNRAGDIFTANHYLNFIPLQEREEWLSNYVKTGDVPYIAIEFGTPLNCSWMRGRAGYGPTISSEPWATEFTSIYGGSGAFINEPRDYRRALRFSMNSADTWGGPGWERILNAPEPVQDMQSLFIRNTWRSWRTAGLTGGMVPWNAFSQCWIQKGTPVEVPQPPFAPGFRGVWKPTLRSTHVGFLETNWETLPSGRVMKEVNSDSLAWIAGPPEAFTHKDKSFRPGEKVVKQAVLISDARTPQTYKVSWSATLGGKPVGAGSGEGTIAPGTNVFLPMEIAIPPDITEPKTDGEITLKATIGESTLEDKFSFRVFGPSAPSKLTALLFDPVGKTSEMLKALGVSTKPWDGKPSAALLVIGREALSNMSKLPGDLQAYTAAGGRVLIMTQNPDWLRTALGFRVSRYVTRQVFPVDKNHPITAGLDSLDLCNWNSHTTLTQAYPEEPNLKAIPTYGWKWGNQGVVASASIEKPHRGGWRPIFESDFDLAYSPLMELDFGKGRVTICTLDLEDQVPADPVAAVLGKQILAYAATAPIAPRPQKVVYIGGDEGAKTLSDLALIFTPAAALDPTALNVLGFDAAIDAAAVDRLIKMGGRIIELARPKGGESRGLNVKVATGFHGSLEPPALPLFAGLSPSDLRLRTEVDYRVIDSGANARIFSNGLFALREAGKGYALSTQIDPALLNTEKIPALRFSRWRQLRALSQVFANSGATFQTDERIFNPRILTLPLALSTWKAQMTVTQPAVPDDKGSARKDPGISPAAAKLVLPAADESGMQELAIPSNYDSFADATGEAVFRLAIDLPPAWAGKILTLELGPIADFDTTYFNGVKVGGLDDKTPEFNRVERKYRIPGNLVKAGRNVIAIRVWDRAFGPGIYGRPELLRLRLLTSDKPPVNFYSSDYIEAFSFGDEPYRYYRW